MDIHFFVKDSLDTTHKVGRALIPVVPRVGETIHLRMSLMGIKDWKLNPANRASGDTAYFRVVEIAYEANNIEEVEDGMGAAPYSEGAISCTVWCGVHVLNEDTQAYIDRIIARGKEEG